MPGGKSASASTAAAKAVCQAVLDFVRAISDGALSSCKLHKVADFPEGGPTLQRALQVLYIWNDSVTSMERIMARTRAIAAIYVCCVLRSQQGLTTHKQPRRAGVEVESC